MVDAHSEHLINKFLNNFREAEEEYPDLPLRLSLQKFENSLDVKKLNPEKLMVRRDCLYELNDALNQCINMANQRGRRRKALIGSKILSLPGLVKYPWLLIRTWRKLREIRKKLGEMRYLRIDEQEITSQVLVIEREALKWINLSEYHGLDEQTKKIEDLMCEKEGNIAIGIVGMSGSGKSAIARKVFFSSSVEQLFELMLWVDLSNAMGSCKKYECISVEKDNVGEIYCGFDLCGLLTEPFLYPQRKCLIVLDGVRHKIEGLDTFIQGILDGPVNGSVIVTSTHVEAKKILLPVEKNSYLHPIEPLREEDCWRIFEDSIKRKNFGRYYPIERGKFITFDGEALSQRNTEILSNMKNEILNRCNGLPLAVKILAEIIPLQLWKKDYIRRNVREEEDIRCDIKCRVHIHDYHTLDEFRNQLVEKFSDIELFSAKESIIIFLDVMGFLINGSSPATIHMAIQNRLNESIQSFYCMPKPSKTTKHFLGGYENGLASSLQRSNPQ
ncbi:NB-ARC domain-containing protein [Forsythia ovata]|uniref:NB-ARC domain-containing protein n=1 Tax=Forsythia ovata TaxID=205694 RepID=A0ABD1V012_9LAMI